MIDAQQNDVSPFPAVPRRILVAEDSPVTQDLLKLILSQRGHTVDIADDGEQALSALGQYSYDVALIDFRLPKLDGLQVAQRYRSERNGEPRARLIAITADVEGLLSHQENCENFDQIIPKPLDIYEVCNVIERTASDGTGADAHEDDMPPDVSGADQAARGNGMAPTTARQSDPTWALGLELLRWPEDFAAHRIATSAIPGFRDLDLVDAILVRGPVRVSDLATIWERKPLHLFPVIDLTGRLGPCADYDASRGRHGDGEAVRALIQAFHQRRSQLHRDLITTSERGEKLLSRLFVQDSGLQAAYNANELSLVSYNIALPSEDAIGEAETLCRSGFLSKEFFDRFHVCYRCSSSRLHIREECPACRSSQLREESYVHHFKCGNQGIETDFRQGSKLICPKCRQELSHFSVDYDKPGSALVCGRCGHAGSEPAVGLVCMDCTAHSDGDTAGSRDIHHYALTPEGLGLLRMGQALRGPGQRSMRFSDLPLEFVVALNAAAKLYNADKTPFAVVNFSYANEREIIREAGLRQFAQARDQFLENLRNGFGDQASIVRGHSYDFGLLHGRMPADSDAFVQERTTAAGHNLRFDLGVSAHIFGPEDFS